jgi:hypothetical protein
MSRAQILAKAMLRDRAERAVRTRKITSTRAKPEGATFDPFAYTRWRLIAGDNPGYLVGHREGRTCEQSAAGCPDKGADSRNAVRPRPNLETQQNKGVSEGEKHAKTIPDEKYLVDRPPISGPANVIAAEVFPGRSRTVTSYDSVISEVWERKLAVIESPGIVPAQDEATVSREPAP